MTKTSAKNTGRKKVFDMNEAKEKRSALAAEFEKLHQPCRIFLELCGDKAPSPELLSENDNLELTAAIKSFLENINTYFGLNDLFEDDTDSYGNIIKSSGYAKRIAAIKELGIDYNAYTIIEQCRNDIAHNSFLRDVDWNDFYKKSFSAMEMLNRNLIEMLFPQKKSSHAYTGTNTFHGNTRHSKYKNVNAIPFNRNKAVQRRNLVPYIYTNIIEPCDTCLSLMENFSDNDAQSTWKNKAIEKSVNMFFENINQYFDFEKHFDGDEHESGFAKKQKLIQDFGFDTKAYNDLRAYRNEIAHPQELTDQITKEATAALKKLKQCLQQIVHELEHEQLYQSFVYSQVSPYLNGITGISERKQLLYAISESLAVGKCISCNFPELCDMTIIYAAESILNACFTLKEIRSSIYTHAELQKNIVAYIFDSLEKIEINKRQINKKYEMITNLIPTREPKLVVKNILNGSIENAYKEIFTGEFDFSCFKQSASQCNDNTEKIKKLSGNFIKTFMKQIKNKKAELQQSIRETLCTFFSAQLIERIQQFNRLIEILQPFAYETAYLWEMARVNLDNAGLDILQYYHTIMLQEKKLQKLAETLEQQNRETVLYEKEQRQTIVPNPFFAFSSAWSGQIVGIKTSDDISSVLPSELVLLKNKKTKKLFALRFAEKQLLSLQYENAEIKNKYREAKSTVIPLTKKSPLIICIDAHEVMHEEIEVIAKTICFAVAKIAAAAKRPCILFSFNRGIEEVELTEVDSTIETPLSKLVCFLSAQFRANANGKNILQELLNILITRDYKKSDILVISDFAFTGIEPAMHKKMLALQKEENLFYSLVIATEENSGEYFDYNWNYNPYESESAKNMARHLEKIKYKLSINAL